MPAPVCEAQPCVMPCETTTCGPEATVVEPAPMAPIMEEPAEVMQEEEAVEEEVA